MKKKTTKMRQRVKYSFPLKIPKTTLSAMGGQCEYQVTGAVCRMQHMHQQHQQFWIRLVLQEHAYLRVDIMRNAILIP